MTNQPDPLDALADLANQIGAEGVWLIRGAKDASLIYTPQSGITPGIPGVQAEMNLTLKLDIADTGVIVLMRFPADDQSPGIEAR